MADTGAHESRSWISPGTRLNDIYEVDRLIGSGGMGDVYQGHTIHTGDRVAIKMLRDELGQDEAALALFRKEASALHYLQHEAIVRYYVCSVDPVLQRPYLAMEFVEGRPLSQMLKQEPLTFEAVRTLSQRLAAGLDAAHSRGIIHRDVAPDNIIVPDGDVSRAKIIDFGIARSTRLGEGTIIGSGFAGKYNYVSPEQLGLYGGDVTAKSDIYSLGLVLAEALTGRAIDMGGSQVDIVEKRRRLPDLSAIDVRLRPLLEKMLQPDPADRPDSMTVVAAWQSAATIRAARRPASVGRDGRLAPEAKAAPWSTVLSSPRTLFSLGNLRSPRVLAAGGAAVALIAVASYFLLSSGPVDKVPPPPPLQANVAPAPTTSPRPATPAPATPPPVTTPAPTTAPPAEATRPPITTPARPTVAQITDFLAKYEGGDCFFMTPISVGDRTARIEGYAASVAPFNALGDAFRRAHGFDAEIGVRQVTNAQCPAVTFLNRLRAQRANTPRIEISDTNLRSGQTLSGTIDRYGNRHVDLLLISDDGSVQNLTRLVRTNNEEKLFHLRMQLANPAGALPQLLMAVTSTQPLNAFQSAQPLTAASAFSAAGSEAGRAGQSLGAAAKYFKLE